MGTAQANDLLEFFNGVKTVGILWALFSVGLLAVVLFLFDRASKARIANKAEELEQKRLVEAEAARKEISDKFTALMEKRDTENQARQAELKDELQKREREYIGVLGELGIMKQQIKDLQASLQQAQADNLRLVEEKTKIEFQALNLASDYGKLKEEKNDLLEANIRLRNEVQELRTKVDTLQRELEASRTEMAAMERRLQAMELSTEVTPSPDLPENIIPMDISPLAEYKRSHPVTPNVKDVTPAPPPVKPSSEESKPEA